MLAILHLSDIHFCEENNSVIEKTQKLYEAIRNDLIQNTHLFIVITGDIAQSGVQKEYKVAKEYLDNLYQLIILHNPNIIIEYIFSAGNHDCDFSINKSARNMIIKNIIQNQDEIDEEIISQCTSVQVYKCTSVQAEYFNFIKSFSSSENIINSVSNDLIASYEFNIDNKKIIFNSYNLAWVSKNPEKQSEIIFPLNLIDMNTIENIDSDLTISLQHHPFHWLKHTNIRKYKEFIDKTSDIVLTGHEHSSSITKNENIINKNIIEHIEGGTLQNSRNDQESTFNFILFDIQDRKKIKHEIFVYEWDSNLYKKSIVEKMSLITNSRPIFDMKQKHEDKINELGLSINHPRVDNVLLEHLFVFPDLKVMNVDSKDTTSNYSEISSNILVKKEVLGLNIIYGADNSGKTTLAKVLQKNIKLKGLVPVLMSGNKFKRGDYQKQNIVKLIKKAFKSQYSLSKNTLDAFEQLNNEEKVLIIDDFHSIHLNDDYKSNLISSLLALGYTNILIFASDNLIYEATLESKLAKSLYDFNHYKVLKFGHLLRDRLITRWIELGQETEINTQDLANERRFKANAINTTIGLNIVPSRPIYLITLFHAMQVHDSSLDKSSYAHYYHFLILQYLNNGRSKAWENNDLNTIFGYLSQLSFNMFEAGKYTYSKSELYRFDIAYKDEVDFEPSFPILDTIINANILEEYEEEEYKFTHKYLYYYFVGYFFSQNVDDEKIMIYIQQMVQRLYRTEFSNILMFTLHLSPKSTIIKLLIEEAEKIFHTNKEFSFSNNELTKLNSSIKEDSSHKLRHKTIDESRTEELEDKEMQTRMEEEYNEEYEPEYDIDINEDIENLDFFKKMNVANKLIEILGEVVKNYAGTKKQGIKNEELIINAYGVGLRTLNTIIEAFEEHHEFLVEKFAEILQKKQTNTQSKIDEAVSAFVFSMASNICLDTVKRISKAVGSKDLKKIYQRISDNSEGNLAYLLIKHAIDLDFPSGLNHDKVLVKLHRELLDDKNLLTDSLVKRLVTNHLYMYETSHVKRASICSKLDIGIDNANKQLINQKK